MHQRDSFCRLNYLNIEWTCFVNSIFYEFSYEFTITHATSSKLELDFYNQKRKFQRKNCTKWIFSQFLAVILGKKQNCGLKMGVQLSLLDDVSNATGVKFINSYTTVMLCVQKWDYYLFIAIRFYLFLKLSLIFLGFRRTYFWLEHKRVVYWAFFIEWTGNHNIFIALMEFYRTRTHKIRML